MPVDLRTEECVTLFYFNFIFASPSNNLANILEGNCQNRDVIGMFRQAVSRTTSYTALSTEAACRPNIMVLSQRKWYISCFLVKIRYLDFLFVSHIIWHGARGTKIQRSIIDCAKSRQKNMLQKIWQDNQITATVIDELLIQKLLYQSPFLFFHNPAQNLDHRLILIVFSIYVHRIN